MTTTGPIRIVDIVHLGPNPEDFEVQAGACFEGDAGCRISITFRPADSGQRLDTIELTTEEGRRYRIDLSGELPIIIL